MANDPTKESRQSGVSSKTSTASPSSPDRSQPGTLTRRDPRGLSGISPFSSVFQRWNDEMDRLFGDFGVGRNWMTERPTSGAWAPQIEVFRRGNNLVVRADLPGLVKDDIQVDINDDVLTIQGERREQHEEEREGWYRNERTYGSFYRAVPLPEGTIADSAKASFKNGVLEVVLQTPPREVSRGRRLDIKEA